MICTMCTRRMAIWKSGLIKASSYGTRYLHMKLGSRYLTIGSNGLFSLKRSSKCYLTNKTWFLYYLVEWRRGSHSMWTPLLMISSKPDIPHPGEIYLAKRHLLGLVYTPGRMPVCVIEGRNLLTGN